MPKNGNNTPQGLDKNELRRFLLADLQTALHQHDDETAKAILKAFFDNRIMKAAVHLMQKYPLVGAKIYHLIEEMGLLVYFIGAHPQILWDYDDQGNEIILQLECQEGYPKYKIDSESFTGKRGQVVAIDVSEIFAHSGSEVASLDETEKTEPIDIGNGEHGVVQLEGNTLVSLKDEINAAACSVSSPPPTFGQGYNFRKSC
ncbi:hypothetical protein ACFL21_02645 [Patescibacteria group bacterium]